jgi:hypothetical protein
MPVLAQVVGLDTMLHIDASCLLNFRIWPCVTSAA